MQQENVGEQTVDTSWPALAVSLVAKLVDNTDLPGFSIKTS